MIRSRLSSLPLVALCGVLVAACAPEGDAEAGEASDAPDVPVPAAGGAQAAPAAVAIAVLHPTDGHDARGTVTFEALPQGAALRAHLSGLAEGTHAFHVHEFGDCSAADATSAGGHFPFDPVSGEPDIVTGNLGELVADASGAASATAEIPAAEMNGPRSVVGRAVVVHERGNDPSAAPTGDTGARVACGVIGLADPSDHDPIQE